MRTRTEPHFMIRRLIVSHDNRERELALVSTIVVGRDPECDVSEDGDTLLSRRHTEFAVGPTGVTVRDLGSRNGTFVNGVKSIESPVHSGDVIQIGHLMVRYVEGDGPVPARPPAAPVVEDDDVTRVVRMPHPPPRQAAPSHNAVEPATDDQTIISPRPSPMTHDDDRTMVITTA